MLHGYSLKNTITTAENSHGVFEKGLRSSRKKALNPATPPLNYDHGMNTKGSISNRCAPKRVNSIIYNFPES